MAAKINSFFWLANVKKIFSSETTWPNGAKLGSKHLCKVLYKVSPFHSVPPTNMATNINFFFWLFQYVPFFSPLPIFSCIRAKIPVFSYIAVQQRKKKNG
jgi:hypothetical protein